MRNEYTLRLEKIEAVIEAWLPRKPDLAWTASSLPSLDTALPPELIQSLTMPAWDLVGRGGKRWRPLLMTLISEVLGGGDQALPLSPLVEFPHTASLIHDDIEDNSEERRGKPAVHLVYGTDTAINSGCFLYFLPLSCMYQWNAPPLCKLKVFEIWGEYMRRLHLGQAMDIAWHRDFFSLPSLAEYESMCRLKTGALARLAAVLGVYSAGGENAGAGETLADKLGRAAESLGVGFQILDDVKNLTTGNPGKKRGDDIVEGKKSLPVLLFLERQPDKKELAARCFAAARKNGIEAPEVEELIAALGASGVIDEARQRGLTLIRGAEKVFSGACFSNLPVEKDALELLTGFTELLV